MRKTGGKISLYWYNILKIDPPLRGFGKILLSAMRVIDKYTPLSIQTLCIADIKIFRCQLYIGPIFEVGNTRMYDVFGHESLIAAWSLAQYFLFQNSRTAQRLSFLLKKG